MERVVYTSSVATIACAANGGQADETMRLSQSSAIGAYKPRKVAAERVVETMIGDDHLPAIIVHPTAPIGPGDQKPTPTGRVIIEAASGRIPGFALSGLHERVQ
jgi:dihydroflavonol-4-reductase